MSQKQNATLRLTINVDFNEPSEVSFIRALLRRTNVLSAKTRPRSALADILKDGKLRDQIEAGRLREAAKRNNLRTPGSTPEPKSSSATNLPALPPPSKKSEVTVKRYEPPKPKFTYISLKEIRHEPPLLAVAGGNPAGGVG